MHVEAGRYFGNIPANEEELVELLGADPASCRDVTQPKGKR